MARTLSLVFLFPVSGDYFISESSNNPKQFYRSFRLTRRVDCIHGCHGLTNGVREAVCQLCQYSTQTIHVYTINKSTASPSSTVRLWHTDRATRRSETESARISIAVFSEAVLKPVLGKPVILSAAKNLKLNQVSREILRCAQDDRKVVLRWIPYKTGGLRAFGAAPLPYLIIQK